MVGMLKTDFSRALPDMLVDAPQAGWDFSAVVNVLKRRWPVLVGALVLGLLAGLLAASLAERRYTATAELLITPNKPSVAGIDAEGVPMQESVFVDNQVQILRSTTLLGRLVDEKKLIWDPEFGAAARTRNQERSWWSSLFAADEPEAAPAGAGAADSAATGSPATQPTLSDQEQADLRAATIQNLAEAFRINRLGMTYLIEVSATSRSPERAAELANALSDLFLVDQLQTRVDASRRTAEWLDQQLGGLRDELTATERAAESFKAANNLVGGAGNTLTEQQRADVNAQLVVARAELASREARLRRANELLASGQGVDGTSEFLTSDAVAALRNRQTELTRRLAELSTRYGDLHPEMVKVRAEVRDVEAQIQTEARRVVANLQNEVLVARSRVNALSGSLNDLQRNAASNDQAAVRLRELEREASSSRQLYETLLEASKKSLVLSNTQGLDVFARATEEAMVPLHPSFPNRTAFMALSAILFLLLGAALVALLEFFDRSFHAVDDAEKVLGIAALSSVPMVQRKELAGESDTGVVGFLLANPLSSYAEALRKWRTGLVFSNVDKPPRVVMITSSLPGEGKTTLACSLAESLATSGFRTLLIDADLRRPSVAKTLMLEPEHDLVDVLAGVVPLDQAIARLGASPLEVLASRHRPANSADLMESRAMEELLATARQRYQYVIVDSAPVLPVVDPVVLSRKVDAVAFVVRWEKTPRDAALMALRRLQQGSAKVAGFVFNAVDLAKLRRTSYSKGDEYYYYGQYSSYYVSKGDGQDKAA